MTIPTSILTGIAQCADLILIRHI